MNENGPTKPLKGWFENIEETFPGYTYYFIAFCLVAFFTPVFEEHLFGETSIVVESVVILGGIGFFIVLYWPTHQDYFKRVLGMG